MSTFALNLRNRIKILNLSEAQVARSCNLSERRFGHYVNGTREPDFSTAIAIARALDTSLDELLLSRKILAKLSNDDLFSRLQHIVQLLSTEDAEIIIEQAQALVHYRQNGVNHASRCNSKEKVIRSNGIDQLHSSSLCVRRAAARSNSPHAAFNISNSQKRS